MATRFLCLLVLVAGTAGCQGPERVEVNPRLRDLREQLKDFEVMYVAPPFRLRLPNLQPRSTRFLIQGDTVTFTQKVANVGDADAAAFDVTLEIELTDATGTTRTHTGTVRFAGGLAAGTDSRLPVTPAVSVAGLARPINVDVAIVVDPATAQRAGGEIWEGVETDNVGVSQPTIF